MSERESYREWAQSVRSEARRSLVALRQERLARKRAQPEAEEAPAVASAPRAAAEGLPLSVSKRTAHLLDVPEETPLGMTEETPVGTVEEAPVEPEAEDVPDAILEEAVEETPAEAASLVEDTVAEPGPATEDSLDIHAEEAFETADPAPEEAALAEPEIEDAAPEEPVAEAETGEAAGEIDPDTPENVLDWTEDALRDSPLMTLPGAGIGLVWLLHANGVTSLETLAATDPDSLRDGLGLVGRLVDLDGWIAFARDAEAA